MLGQLARQVVQGLRRLVLHRFSTHAADEFRKFTEAPIGNPDGPLVQSGTKPAGALYLGGATFIRPQDPRHCEELFTNFQKLRKYEDMWMLLAPEAQASWGSRESFVRQTMEADSRVRVVGSEVDDVQILPVWTDRRRQKTYRNVAELKVKYHLKADWKDLALERDVHLVHVDGGWRTLCFRD
ncbi:MAG: hypothetical protein ACYDAY_10835 [Candidatus Dormibacteria bacterium]